MLALARADRRHRLRDPRDRPAARCSAARWPAPRRRSSAPRDTAPAAARRSRRSRCAAAPRRARRAAAGGDSRSAPRRSPARRGPSAARGHPGAPGARSRSRTRSDPWGSSPARGGLWSADRRKPITSRMAAEVKPKRAGWPARETPCVRDRLACQRFRHRLRQPCGMRLAMKDLVEILWRSLTQLHPGACSPSSPRPRTTVLSLIEAEDRLPEGADLRRRHRRARLPPAGAARRRRRRDPERRRLDDRLQGHRHPRLRRGDHGGLPARRRHRQLRGHALRLSLRDLPALPRAPRPRHTDPRRARQPGTATSPSRWSMSREPRRRPRSTPSSPRVPGSAAGVTCSSWRRS